MTAGALREFLDVLGVNAGGVLAGFCGALGRIGLFGVGPHGGFATVFSVIGGTVTAIYLGPVAPAYLGWPDNAKSTFAITFLIGMFGMEICNQISVVVRKWSPTMKGTPDA